MDATLADPVALNGTDDIWSGTFEWDKRDSRLDNLPMMSTLWPTIGVTVCYALGSGILLKGKLTPMKIYL